MLILIEALIDTLGRGFKSWKGIVLYVVLTIIMVVIVYTVAVGGS